MDCGLCETRSSVGFCVECKILLCESCSVACEACKRLVCPNHLLTTSHGRKLCRPCFEERKARREARETSLGVLKEKEGLRLKREERLIQGEEEEMLAASGYKPPSLLAYGVVLTFFLAVGVVLYLVLPEPKKILWPFEANGLGYTKNMMAPIQDRNTLRNASNIANLNIVYHILFFLVGWGFLLLYLYGLGLVVFVALRGAFRKILPRIRGPVIIISEKMARERSPDPVPAQAAPDEAAPVRHVVKNLGQSESGRGSVLH